MHDGHERRRREVMLRLGERVATILRLDVPCAWQAINPNAETVAELDESIDAAIKAAEAFGWSKPGKITTRTPDSEVN